MSILGERRSVIGRREAFFPRLSISTIGMKCDPKL
jgi:hypothetical protein